MAGTTRLELATSAVTGQRSNQLNYVPAACTPAANLLQGFSKGERNLGKAWRLQLFGLYQTRAAAFFHEESIKKNCSEVRCLATSLSVMMVMHLKC